MGKIKIGGVESKGTSGADKFFDASAKAGKWYMVFGVVILGIISISMLIISIIMFTKKEPEYVNVIGRIINADCDLISNSSNSSYKYYCTLNVQFLDGNGNNVTKKITVSNSPVSYIPGESIELEYPKGSPERVIVCCHVPTKTTAIILLILSLVFGVIAFVIWLLRNNPAIATFSLARAFFN